ncbi:MAG: hypothetical protein H6712_00370 [Myxococcales bacterium]|nr:hypothetical protein [Myxococcales bacterium]MCB9712279.1 hypothetical protein [Myxococcales bacterium]
MLWGVAGVVALLVQPLLRLTPMALEAIQSDLSGLQWTVLAAWLVVNAHAEGYRGFHRRFSPRVVARAQVIARSPRPLWVVLAPLFCMSLFHASRRGLWVARILVLAIVLLVMGVRQLSQPWRGIVDAGVVLGLTIGTVSLLYYFVAALLGRVPPVPPDLPPESDDDRAA